MSTDVVAKTLRQEELAKTGEAEGQCPFCGMFRSDGKPPILHRAACGEAGLVQRATFSWMPRLPDRRQQESPASPCGRRGSVVQATVPSVGVPTIPM
jgi:hypothetical protein